MSKTPSRQLHHGLLNHIGVISTYVQLLQDSELDDEQKELVREIAESTDQAHALATELGQHLEPHLESEERRQGGNGASS